MKRISMHEAKTHLSRLVREVGDGTENEIIICVGDRAAARLVPIGKPSARPLGIDAGLVHISPDFDSVDAEITRLFDA